MLQLQVIGEIQSCYPEKFGTPRQPGLVSESWAVIRLKPELNLVDGLAGLQSFSHLWVIFEFHLNTNKGIKAKVHPPRMGGEKIGVFATRSPHRPNPIGLSVVKIEKIENGEVYVSGVDFVDGTPVLDIKPYLPSADCVVDAKAGWTENKEARPLQVAFTEDALLQVAELQSGRSPQKGDLKQLITSNLELDPRPVSYRGTPENQNPYMDTYGFALENLNVIYKMQGQLATVLRLESYAEWKARSSGKPPSA